MIEPRVGVIVIGADSLFVVLYFDFDILSFSVFLGAETLP